MQIQIIENILFLSNAAQPQPLDWYEMFSSPNINFG